MMLRSAGKSAKNTLKTGRHGVRHGYSWNMFCREVGHQPQPEALELAGLLLSRDISAEMALGSLLGSRSRGAFEKATGFSPELFIVTLLRIANRYAWLERAASKGLPDPLYDPIPPICYSGRETVERVFKKHVEPYLREAFYVQGHVHTLDVFAQAVLYAFGYLPGKPAHIPDEIWERAVGGLFGQHQEIRWLNGAGAGRGDKKITQIGSKLLFFVLDGQDQRA
jgi:hypothetical protein